ncbi:GNAT family N-acetyltransferase [Streptomyces sp. NPDC048664]|uniref:GNAT family N-acetyltransferase n=1 Tax=Streptomyces sp. NPDC048664 TaxID=3154505 RepID=UPI003416BB94
MRSTDFTSGTDGCPAVVTHVAQGEWHALEDDRLVGRGDAWHRPDGRLFVSVDSWRGAVFDQLADAMAAALPRPLYTMVDETDADLASRWERVGFASRRREWECLVPTDPRTTGLDPVPPQGVTIVPLGAAQEGPLRALYGMIRDEVEATVGWQEMPAQVLPGPDTGSVVDPSRYAVAVRSGDYVGLLRVTGPARQPRLGLVAVRADQQRRGVSRALLAQVLGELHGRGVRTAWAEVGESNQAARALLDGIGAQRVRGNVELVLR